MNPPNTFAQRLVELRQAAGLSVAEMAKRAEISRPHAYCLERGQRQPTLEVARRIARVFGRRLDCWEDDD